MVTTNRPLRGGAHALAALLVLAFFAGCPRGPDYPRPEDADRASGNDWRREGAVRILPNVASPSDEVSRRKRDVTDWKVIELKGRPATLSLKLRWADDRSDLHMDLFDSLGRMIGTSAGRSVGATDKEISARIDELGTYYIRVQALGPDDEATYTVLPKWDGDPATFAAHAHIVQSYREEHGQLTLHLDQGSEAGLAEGMVGAVLDGPEGDRALGGGTLTIVRVVGPTKSIASTPLQSIGGHRRCAINIAH